MTLFTILNANSSYPYKKYVKQFESYKVSLGKLEILKDIDFFSWYLYSKMKDSTLHKFKLVKISKALSIPVLIDKSVLITGPIKTNVYFEPIGQLLE